MKEDSKSQKCVIWGVGGEGDLNVFLGKWSGRGDGVKNYSSGDMMLQLSLKNEQELYKCEGPGREGIFIEGLPCMGLGPATRVCMDS